MDYPEDRDDKDNSFPPGYEHLDEIMRNAKERIQQIDEQIKNVPPDKGPSPEYLPPGAIRSRQPGSRGQTIAYLEKAKEQIKVDTLDSVEQEAKQADPETAKGLRNNALKQFNPYANMTEAEIEAKKGQDQKSQAKYDIEALQNYFDAQRGRPKKEKETSKEKDMSKEKDNPNEKDTPTPTDPEASKEGKGSLSMSERFSQSLSYTQAERGNKDVEKDKSPDKQKEQPEIDRD